MRPQSWALPSWTPQSWRWFLLAPASVALGWALDAVGLPAAWIIGAIVVAGTWSLSTGEQLHVHPVFYRFGRGIIMTLAAVPLTKIPAADLVHFLLPGLFVTAFTVTVGVAGGVLLSRAQPRHISPETGVLSMLPGGASVVSTLAIDFGANFRYVMLTQFLRVLVLSLTLPVIVHLFMSGRLHEEGLSSDSPWWMLLVFAAIALGSEPVARKLRVPAATALGPLLATVLAAAVLPDGVEVAPPAYLAIVAFLSIGWVCGGSLQRDTLAFFAKQLPATFAFLGALMAVCALSAWPLTMWLDISYFEAYLATSPGALETVLALSAEGSAGAEVVAIQIIRLLAVLLLASWLPQVLHGVRKLRR